MNLNYPAGRYGRFEPKGYPGADTGFSKKGGGGVSPLQARYKKRGGRGGGGGLSASGSIRKAGGRAV